MSRERSGRSLDVRIPSALTATTRRDTGTDAAGAGGLHSPLPKLSSSLLSGDNDEIAGDATERCGDATDRSNKGRTTNEFTANIIRKDPRNAIRIIERAWLSLRDRQLFSLLKNSICAAEASLSMEILRRVCPKEAILLKDKSLSCKVRLRFGGEEFPPHIYFKIFLSSPDITIKYISGRTMIVPASEAARDACSIMGNRRFYDQVIADELQRQGDCSVTDASDVVTLKDYMQYLSVLDESPACRGGRDNNWRKLSMENVPRRAIFHDVLSFVETRRMTQDLVSFQTTSNLSHVLPILMEHPLNQDVQLEQIRLISKLREIPLKYEPNTKPIISENDQKWSRKATKKRANRMRRLYSSLMRGSESALSNSQSLNDNMSTPLPPATNHLKVTYNDTKVEHLLRQDEVDEEARKLYEWTLTL